MKKLIVLAALLAAAPVFAHDRDRDDDDDYDYQDEQPPQYAPPQQYLPPDQGPTYDDFRNDSELDWNGEWIETSEYGTVWRPTRVSDSWQPYMYGRWAWTDAGWAWVSDEPFGWAVYHYGRWAFTDAGWFWVPGRVWAPAWVAWRWGDGYAGWCPLGPRSAVYQQPQQWVVVENRHFLEPIRRNVISRTQPIALPPAGTGPRAGPAVRVVERAIGRTIRPLAVTDAPAPHAAQAYSNSVGFYRPRTAPIASGPQRPQAGAQRPIYFGGVPASRQGGQPRPQAGASAGGAHALPSKSGQNEPHAKER